MDSLKIIALNRLPTRRSLPPHPQPLEIMSMTLDEAKQKILEKVLSLQTGWRSESCKVNSSSYRADYTHPELPDLMLSRSGGLAWIAVLPECFALVEQGSRLNAHIDAILKDMDEKRAESRDARIIQIAESL